LVERFFWVRISGRVMHWGDSMCDCKCTCQDEVVYAMVLVWHGIYPADRHSLYKYPEQISKSQNKKFETPHPSIQRPISTQESSRPKNSHPIPTTPPRLTARLPLTRTTAPRRSSPNTVHRPRRRARLRPGIRRVFDFLAAVCFVVEEDVTAAAPDVSADRS
jgi:hypothetical protein